LARTNRHAPVLLAVAQEFGRGARLGVPVSPIRPGPLEVGEHEDVEHLGAGSATEGIVGEKGPNTGERSARGRKNAHGLKGTREIGSHTREMGLPAGKDRRVRLGASRGVRFGAVITLAAALVAILVIPTASADTVTARPADVVVGKGDSGASCRVRVGFRRPREVNLYCVGEGRAWVRMRVTDIIGRANRVRVLARGDCSGVHHNWRQEGARIFIKVVGRGDFDCYVTDIVIRGVQTPTPTPPPGQETLRAEADTWADSGRPSTNFGSFPFVRAGLSHDVVDQIAYLRFLSPRAGTGTLRLCIEQAFAQWPALEIHAVADDSWTEGGLTWNNRPEVGRLVTTLERTAGCHGIQVPVEEGANTFAILHALTETTRITSDEGAAEQGPELTVP
jgi:hypothetical protein